MLVVGGVHPYALRRRKVVLFRSKPSQGSAAPALLFALLLIAGFAYGLRSIERRFAPTDPAPPVEVQFSDTEIHDLNA